MPVGHLAGTRTQRRSRSGQAPIRRVSSILMLLLAVLLLGSLTFAPVVAQEAAPAEVVDAETTTEPAAATDQPATVLVASEQVQLASASLATGSLEIRLTDANGVGLSGLFAVTDATGAYQERWTERGGAVFPELNAGTATISQIAGTTDYAFDGSVPSYVGVPAGGQVVLPIVNALLDADGDGVGDSIDTCGAGSDIADTDADGVADACDETPSGVAPLEPASSESGEIVAGVATEPVVVADSPVTCQQAADVAPWITTDLADYPPGALVTLAGGNWVAGQTIEILVEDDGVADAEMGPWSHAATVTADEQGGVLYQFNLAPWYVANYSVVATGECAEARTEFTDSVSGGNCVQVTASDIVSPGQYVMFRCPSPLLTSPYIAVTSITAGWQWAYQYGDANLTPPPYSSLTWRSTTGETPASGLLSQAYLFLSPTTAVPSSVGSITVQARSLLVLAYTSTLTASRAISASDFALLCTPASFSVQAASTQPVTCSLTAITIASGASIGVSIPAIPTPTGWTITSPNPSAGTVTLATPFTFTVSLTPSCTAATTTQSVSILSNLTFSTQSTAGPSTTLGISRGAAASTVSAAISSATLAWTRPYSFSAYPTNTGTLTYSVQASGCLGWNVTVSASPFVRAGGTKTIAASNLTLTTTTTPSGTGLSTPTSSGALNSSLKVLSASAGNGNGTYSQTLTLKLNIPAATPVGTYTSTVTITAASGP